jgi:Kef-type K+ transport system membrane component KefB
MHFLDESQILIFLLQLILLLGLSRAAGLALQRVGQPAITGEILVGICLGPTLFGRLLPGLHAAVFPACELQQNMLETVAWLGILFFLLEAGLETNLTAAWRQRRDALAISLADLVIPMAIAFVPALFLPAAYVGAGGNRLLFSLFIATILTISALPVTARILQELGIYRSDASLLTMCALTINDIAGWVVFAVLLGFAADATTTLSRIPIILAGTALFAVLSLTVGRRLTDRALAGIDRCGLPQPGSSLTLICLLGMVAGAVTLRLGVHALFGFFIAGIMAGESRHLSENTRQTISQMVKAVLVPLFFASIGLKLDFLRELDLRLLAFLLVIGTAGRFIGAWVGVGLTRHPRTNRHLIAAAHTPGGEMQIVIGMVALEYAVITPPVFVAIVVSAVLSSILLGPWMKAALERGRGAGPTAFLVREHILPALTARTREDAIRALARVAALGVLDEEAVAQAVLRREELMGTALGHGVAVPHARLPEVATPRIVFGRAPAGLDWNTPDGEHVHLVFLILTPAAEDRSQLEILRVLAHALHSRDTVEALVAAPDAELAAKLLALLKQAEAKAAA